MQQEQADALRKPFNKTQIDQIPKRNNKTGNTIYLDYVGHAHVTDRLLQVDPSWTWQPVAFDQTTGQPVTDEFGGLWIVLTVCGVTRYGYGWADGDKGGNAIKEAIGDAIRNASMRFGVALDLWMKEPASPPAPTKPAKDLKPVKKLPANVPASLDDGERIAVAYAAIALATTVESLRTIWSEHADILDIQNNDTTIRAYINQRKDEIEQAG